MTVTAAPTPTRVTVLHRTGRNGRGLQATVIVDPGTESTWLEVRYVDGSWVGEPEQEFDDYVAYAQRLTDWLREVGYTVTYEASSRA